MGSEEALRLLQEDQAVLVHVDVGAAECAVSGRLAAECAGHLLICVSRRKGVYRVCDSGGQDSIATLCKGIQDAAWRAL